MTKLPVDVEILQAAAHAAHLCALEGWSLEGGGRWFSSEEVAKALEEIVASVPPGELHVLKYSPEGTEVLQALGAIRQASEAMSLALERLGNAVRANS